MDYDRDTIKEWVGNSTLRAIRADLARYKKCGYSGWGTEGFWATLLFRVQKSVRAKRPWWLWKLPAILIAIIKKFFTAITHMDIHPDARVGPGLLIPHVGPLRIHGLTTIGADCAIHQVVTIGAGPTPGGATIGDHVLIGCHSSVIGPVTIGDGSVIAANSLVIADVPPGSTAIGVPARVYVSMPNSQASGGSKTETR